MGTLVCLLVTALRIMRFHRMLRFAVAAPRELQEETGRLASRMGLRSTPGVWLVPGAVCPMLFWGGWSRPRVLVPRTLWGKLDEAQRRTLLTHELAHLVRRDHWVRWVELLATAMYWWNPVCWWARHELREAEEQCCDAWVLWTLPGQFREYANALLEAVDFVSARSGGAPFRSPVPALASGMGQFGHLKRRLTMLKKGDVARALSWSGLSAAFGVGALLLPIAPTWGQSADTVKQETTNTTPVVVEKTVTVTSSSADTAPVAVAPSAESSVAVTAAAPGTPPAPPSITPPPPPADLDVEEADEPREKDKDKDKQFRREMQDMNRLKADQQRARADQQRAQAELARAQAEVQQLSQRLQQASMRLAKMQMELASKGMAGAGLNLKGPDGAVIGIKPFTFDAKQMDEFMRSKSNFSADALPRGRTETRTDSKDDRGQRTDRLEKTRIDGKDDRDQRMDRLEKELSQLMNEVRQLRRENRPQPKRATPPSEPEAPPQAR
jgi:beta-lactamase regulating signal transducer with metallopeptidase domain